MSFQAFQQLLMVLVGVLSVAGCAPAPRGYAPDVELRALVGKQVHLEGQFDGPGKLADYVVVSGEVVYLMIPKGSGGERPEYGSTIVVDGILGYRNYQPSKDEDAFSARAPDHYFIENPKVRVIRSPDGALLAPADDSGRFEPKALGMTVPVLVRADELDGYLGRLVAVRGTVSDSKIPRIAGVEVRADNNIRGREGYAVGVLIKWTVTKEDVEVHVRRLGPFSNDGRGTKYVLYFDLSGKIAEAQPISENKSKHR